MKQVCPENVCTGCGACLNACPRSCIVFVANECGEMLPRINEKLCVDCGVCQKVCPIKHSQTFNYPKKCIAAYRTDRASRARSASGGIGSLLAEYIVSAKQGVVYGSRYDLDLNPIMGRAETLHDLEAMKGSRYVQSMVGPRTYVSVRQDLENGRWVLFIGTPCQIAGVKSFLGKDFERLLLVDLICHGVCGSECFRREIDAIRARVGVETISDIRFRGNDDGKWGPGILQKILARYNGNNYAISIWSGDKRIYQADWRHNYYLGGYILGVSLRENCYECKYARPDRISDLTIGDYIGLGKRIPFCGNADNASVALVSSAKGLCLWEQVVCWSGEGLYHQERPYGERLEYLNSLVEPTKKVAEGRRYREACCAIGTVKALRKVMKKKLMCERLKNLIAVYGKVLKKKVGF